jgi:hypothetical protein
MEGAGRSRLKLCDVISLARDAIELYFFLVPEDSNAVVHRNISVLSKRRTDDRERQYRNLLGNNRRITRSRQGDS